MQRKVEEVNKLIKIANNHDQFSPAMYNGVIEEINNYTILFSKDISLLSLLLFFWGGHRVSARTADPFSYLPRRV